MRDLLFFTILIAFFSCQNTGEQLSIDISVINAPSSGHAEVPRLTTSDNGKVYMSWIEQDGENAELKYAELDGNTWSAPKLISKGNNWFVNWADFPSIIAGGDYLVAHWLQKRDQGTYDYDIHISTSQNGEDWSKSFIPHKDGISAEHGFVSMLPMKEKRFFATWLDGRNTKSTGHDPKGHNGAMSLRAGIFDIDGNTIHEWELDEMTCDCCQTGAVMGPKGPIVVYRDRSENEIRDIYVTRLVENQWTSPRPVSVDLWQIAGCPVNGPAIAANSSAIAVAHFDAAGNTPKVKLSLSDDGGESFKPSIAIAEGNTIGRLGITSLSDNTFIVSWVRSIGGNATIMLSRYAINGDLIQEYEIGQTSAERASGFPVITSKGTEVVMAWTESDELNEVKTAKIKF